MARVEPAAAHGTTGGRGALLLEVDALATGYGRMEVVRDLSFRVGRGGGDGLREPSRIAGTRRSPAST